MPVITVGTPSTVYMVVDSEAMFHRAYHAFTSEKICLRTSTDILSGGFHGFFNMLYNQIQSFSPKEIIFCWGDKRANLLRRNLYPAYKGNRSDTPRKGFDEQLLDVMLVLDVMGFIQYTSPGYEGDDVITAVVTEKLQPYIDSDPTAEIAILSSDKDMLQLVNNKVTVYHVASSIPVEFTPTKVEDKYGIRPELLADYFCLVGDDSDNVPGVAGIGPVVAARLLQQNGPIHEWFNKIDEIQATDTVKAKLKASRVQMVISKKLVSLDYNKAPLKKISFMMKDMDPSLFFNKYEETQVQPHYFLFNQGGDA